MQRGTTKHEATSGADRRIIILGAQVRVPLQCNPLISQTWPIDGTAIYKVRQANGGSNPTLSAIGRAKRLKLRIYL